jgi:hypothetical protein
MLNRFDHIRLVFNELSDSPNELISKPTLQRFLDRKVPINFHLSHHLDFLIVPYLNNSTNA